MKLRFCLMAPGGSPFVAGGRILRNHVTEKTE